MPITRLTHIQHKKSGITADDVVNVWHFWHPFNLNVLLAQKIGFAVNTFYCALNTDYSTALDRTNVGQTFQIAALTMNAAGVDDDVLAPPVYSFNDTLQGGTAPTGEPLPNEIAVCMSFSSNLDDVPEESAGGTMRPAARRRGRLYLGPFQVSILDHDPIVFDPQIKAAFRTKILTAYGVLITSLQATTTPTDVPQRVSHIVYSPTSGLEWKISRVWVDSDFDVVRSRGVKSLLKTEQAVVQSQALV